MDSKYLSTVHAMIEQDLATSRQLLALLEKETDSTQARDFAAMSELLKEKTPLLDGLKKNAQIRSQLLLSSNQAANEKNWSLLLESFNDDKVKQTWQDVKATIEHCKTINNVNGMNIQIASAAEEQAAVVQEINRNSHSVNELSGKNVDASSQVSSASEQIEAISKQVLVEISYFKF